MNEKDRSIGPMGKKKHKSGNYLKKVFSCCTLGILLSGGLLIVSTVQAEPELIVLQEVEVDIKNMSSGQEPMSREITIYDAMARAIKYNREHRLKKMQSALAMQQRDKSYFDFLPELTASAGYTGRNNESASSSKSYATGLESLEPSISEDENLGTSGISLSWSALDFGLSYARSQQLGNRYFIAKEVERKTVQNIISDVRREWWNAISAQRLLSQIDPFVQRVETALDDSREIENLRLESPLIALTYQRSLIDMLRTLERLRERLNRAKHRLISLMGTSYGENFILLDSETRPDISTLVWDVATMENVALLSRPELMQSRYEDRITAEETRIAILGLIPDVNLNAGWSWDSNSYLVHNSWFNYGAQISWNLMELFKAPSAMRTAESEEKVSKERRMAVAMTVIMQVHFAKVNYLQSVRQFEVEDLALSVENRILKQITSASTTEKQGKQTLIREQLNQLLAEVRNDNAYAELQDSLGRIFVSLGIDTVPLNIESMTVAELSRYLVEGMETWQTSSLKDASSINNYLPETTPFRDHKPVSLVKNENDSTIEVVFAPPQTIEVVEITKTVEADTAQPPISEEKVEQLIDVATVDGDAPSVPVESADTVIVNLILRYQAYSTALTEKSLEALDKNTKTILENQKAKIDIFGYTASKSNSIYNIELSRQRAEAVKQHLLKLGVKGDQITAKGMGNKNPVASNDTREGRRQNRRVELIVSTFSQATEVAEIKETVEVDMAHTSLQEETSNSTVQQTRIIFTGDSIDIRNAPDLEAKILARASVQDSSFPVLEETEEWTKIAFGQTNGWVSNHYIKVTQ